MEEIEKIFFPNSLDPLGEFECYIRNIYRVPVPPAWQINNRLIQTEIDFNNVN